MTARRNQLVILLAFISLVGIFLGVAIWLISQSQQKERDLFRVQSDLQQTAQQMQILKEQNISTLKTRSKLQKDVTTLKKQLDFANKQGVSLEKKLKDTQTISSTLATENSSLKVRLAATEQQLAALKQSFNPAITPSKSTAPKSTVPTSTIFAPASPVPTKR